jgi:hypothetical protein
MLDHDHHRLGHPHVNPIDAGVRADERMRAMAQGEGRATSRRTRLAVGWAFVIVIVGFFAAFALGWIDLVPSS